MESDCWEQVQECRVPPDFGTVVIRSSSKLPRGGTREGLGKDLGLGQSTSPFDVILCNATPPVFRTGHWAHRNFGISLDDPWWPLSVCAYILVKITN